MKPVDDSLRELLRDAFSGDAPGAQAPDFGPLVVRRARAADRPPLPRATLLVLMLAFLAACVAALAFTPDVLAELREGLTFWIAR